MPDAKTITSDWTCRVCGNFVRGRAHPPAYCSKCSVGTFLQTDGASPSPSRGTLAGPSMPTLPGSALSARLADSDPRQLTNGPKAPGRGQRCQPAKRLRPKEPLEVRLARTMPLEAVDISVTGLLVEHARPFPPGSICEVELWRSSLGIRLRAEVVRSVVSGGGLGSQTGIRYRTAVHFLETPQSILILLPELAGHS